MAHKGELLKQQSEKRRLVNGFKSELRSLSDERFTLIKQQRSNKEAFLSLVTKIKKLRKERDEHTTLVKELKQKRQSASSAARHSRDNIEHLKDSTGKERQKSPGALKSEIDRIEYEIETSGMPFKEEQKLTKIIKEKKQELKASVEYAQVLSKLKRSSKQLRYSKEASDSAHKSLQEHADQSQKLHEEMIGYAKKADVLKQKIGPVEKKIKATKAVSTEKKALLTKAQEELQHIDAQLDKMFAEEKAAKDAQRKQDIAKKEDELTEKIKSGHKLTNLDLLALKDD